MKIRFLFVFILCFASVSLLAQTGKLNGHEYVDLGLSVKWATCNIGANAPEKGGTYYAWGETMPKYDYAWYNYFDAIDDEAELFYEYFTSTFNRRGKIK